MSPESALKRSRVASPERINLTLKRSVDALKPRAAEYRVYDSKLSGFGLRIAPSGRKSFFIQYRYRGIKRRMYLGETRKLTAEQAHKIALQKLADVAGGKDPLAEKRATAIAAVASARSRRASPTVADVAEQYLETLSLTKSAKWSYEAKRMYSAHIAPALGKMKVADVTTADVRRLHEKQRKTATTANRTRAVLSAILSRAIADGARPTGSINPADGVKPYDEAARERYLSTAEWKRLGEAIMKEREALTGVPEHDTRPYQLDAIILILLTGGRLHGVTRRKWSEFDVDARVLRIAPAHKGATKLYLGETAFNLLRMWQAQRGNHPFIFPGQERRIGTRTLRRERDVRPKREPRPIATIRPVWDSLCERASLTDLHPHDLRRSFAVTAGDVGISTHLIGGLLSHVVGGVTGVYAHRSDPALLEAATKVSAEVARRIGLIVQSEANVIPIASRAKRVR